jgi:hypothetical protein
MYRPEVATLLSNLIRMNPENVGNKGAQNIKVLLVKSLVDLVWSGHPDTMQPSGASDGVAFDVLHVMSDPSQLNVVRNTFQHEILRSTAAPYSPGFAKELGMFLLSNNVDLNATGFDTYQNNYFRRFLPTT